MNYLTESNKKFDIVGFIKAKRKKQTHDQVAIDQFISLIADKEIPDYQISAWLMAVALNGLTDEETCYLTNAMLKSGVSYDLRGSRLVIDKHSTGGVGDTTSIIIGPILASCGVSVAKLSGKGLGFSGGTIDKLNSLGVKTDLKLSSAKEHLEADGLLVIQQTSSVAPVDRILYSIRDVTATVDSLPLIAASVMSKKLSFITNHLFLDVKYGQGAFCKDLTAAKELSRLMAKIAKQAGVNYSILITSMQQPLGSAVGNLIELVQVHDFLKQKPTTKELTKLVESFCVEVLTKVGKQTPEEALANYQQALSSGAAFATATRWFVNNGADLDSWTNKNFFQPKFQLDVLAPNDGYCNIVDNSIIGTVSVQLGAGRKQKYDTIDYQAGIKIHVRINDYVTANTKIATLYSSKPIDAVLVSQLLQAFEFRAKPIKINPLIVYYE